MNILIRCKQGKTVIAAVLLLLLYSLAGCGEKPVQPQGKIKLSLSSPITVSAENERILWVSSVAFAPDGSRALSSGGEDNTIRLWDLSSGKLLRTFKGHADLVSSAGFSPDGGSALSGSRDKTMRLWDVESGKVLRTFKGHSGFVRSVAFSADGRRVLSGSSDKTVRLWDVENGKLLHTLKGDSNTVLAVSLSPSGLRALSGSADTTVRLWDLNEGQLLRTFNAHSDLVLSVDFSPDGQYALSGSSDTTMRLWDLDRGKLLHTFEGHSDAVWSVRFSPSGRYALSGSWDNTLRLWEVESGRLIRVFKGHSEEVYTAAFSPDGHRILSGGNDGVFLWETETKTPLVRMMGFGENEWATVIIPEGFFAASSAGSKNLSVQAGGVALSDNSLFRRPDLVQIRLAGDSQNLVAGARREVIEKLTGKPNKPPVSTRIFPKETLSDLRMTFLGATDARGIFSRANRAIISPGKEAELVVRIKNQGSVSGKVVLKASSENRWARFKHFKTSAYTHESLQHSIGMLSPGESVKVKWFVVLDRKSGAGGVVPVKVSAWEEKSQFKPLRDMFSIRIGTAQP
ncbi:MAG: WD40 repeat domain-containing protein [Gammaproteobacteria bacterium]|nr:WD40 repeat domain-containing protein [Gammaproteobacteria bacterium]